MGATEDLAHFVVETSYRDIPDAALQVAKAAMLDCLGTALAGSREPVADIVCAYVAELEAKPVASIVGRGLRTAPTEAALVNGILAHALDYDDVNNPLSGHPSVPVLPAVLALGEQLGAPGRDLLTAYVVGFETEVKLGRAVNPEHYRLGWHATSTLGTLGAAAAAAHLLALDVAQTRLALGLAASQSAGLRQNFGTMAKPFHPGNAARSGVLAAQLARKGFTADASILETPLGFCRLFAGEGHYDLETALAGLGERWDLIGSGVGFKQYPCCAFTHPAVDAMLDLVRVYDLAPADLETVEAQVSPLTAEVLIHNDPRTALEGKFSLQFCLAIALLDRQVGLRQFTDEKVRQPETRGLIARTRMIVREDLPPSIATPAVVTLTLRDGRTVSREVLTARGQPQNPLREEELLAKYLDCAAVALAPDEARASLAMMRQLEDLPDIRQLMRVVGQPGFRPA